MLFYLSYIAVFLCFFTLTCVHRTGGVHLTLEQFASINDLFMAVCFREFSADQLQNFEQEVTQGGRMNRAMVKVHLRAYVYVCVCLGA